MGVWEYGSMGVLFCTPILPYFLIPLYSYTCLFGLKTLGRIGHCGFDGLKAYGE